ncbi:type IV pilus assembly protein FimV [Halomonas sp. LS-001]
MKRSFILASLAVWALTSPLAMALNIGDPRVDSFLDAPLQATVPLTGTEGYGADAIRVRLADPSAFRALGLDWSATTQSVSVTLQEGSPPYLRLTSSAPVREPWLDLLITLESPDGRQTQALTLLLDPPGSRSPGAVSSSSASSSTGSSATAPTPPSASPSASRERVNAPASASPSNYVASGDTLWSVAERLKPPQASVQQMMLALFEANSNLFPSGNINEMRAGYRLQIPEDSQVFSRTSDAAADAIRQINRTGGGPPQVASEQPSETAAPEAPADVAPQAEDANNALNVSDLSTMISAPAIEAAQTLDSRLRDAQLIEQQVQLDQLLQERVQRQAEIADLRRQVENLTDALSASQAAEDPQVAGEVSEPVSDAGQNSPATNGDASADSEMGVIAKAASWTQGVYQQALRESRLLLAAGAILLLLLLVWMIRRRQTKEWQNVEQNAASSDAEPTPESPHAAGAATVVAQAAPTQNDAVPAQNDTAPSQNNATQSTLFAASKSDAPVSFSAKEETLDVDDVETNNAETDKLTGSNENVSDAPLEDVQAKAPDPETGDLETHDLETSGSAAEVEEWPSLDDSKVADTPYWSEDEEADLGRSQAAGLTAQRNAEPVMVLDDESPSEDSLDIPETDDGRSHFIDYHPPSLSEEPRTPREETPMQPTVDFPASGEAPSQAPDSGSPENERRPTTQSNEEDSPLGEGWEIEEVAFHRSGRDNKRSS